MTRRAAFLDGLDLSPQESSEWWERSSVVVAGALSRLAVSLPADDRGPRRLRGLVAGYVLLAAAAA